MTTNNAINTHMSFDETFRQKLVNFYMPSAGEKAPSPQIIKLNQQLANQLGINPQLHDKDLAELFTGSKSAKGAQPIAQIYAGHQFGSFNPQLGDGRAILMAEVLSKNNVRLDIHLKGSGITPFSRGGDGKAALGPMLREYILGEAMYALGIPTTRGLAVTTTGEKVMRQKWHHGAVLARVASSHIRVGSFQYFAARGQHQQVTQLADYTIDRHFPELCDCSNPYRHLLKVVSDRQASLIAQWMLVGFVHGVMNTDNVAISGETIDFGPCAFIDEYDAKAVYSSIDRAGRYALGNQPMIGQWNMARFAESILHLLDNDSDKAIEYATDTVENFADMYHKHWLKGINHKLGLSAIEADDSALAQELLSLLQKEKVDFTLFFRQLSEAITDSNSSINVLFSDVQAWQQWHKKWVNRVSLDPRGTAQQIKAMNAVNPLYIPRNHLVEAVIEAAETHLDFAPFEELLTVLAQPFTKRSGYEKYTHGAPKDFGPYRTFCGT